MTGLVLDAVVVVLLTVAIAYMFVLNRRLSRIRDAGQSLQPAIEEFDTATRRAEDSVSALKAQAAALRGSVQNDAGKVTALRDELAFLCDRADEQARRLESLIRDSRPAVRLGAPDTGAEASADISGETATEDPVNGGLAAALQNLR